MRSQAATPQFTPAQGAAPTAAEKARQLLALIKQCHARDQVAQRRSSYLAPASLNPLDEPATDPARWQGFL